MPPRLVVRGGIQADESLPGYVTRLSHANGISPPLLMKRAALPIGHEFRSVDFDLLASLGASDPMALATASFAPDAEQGRHQFNGCALTRPHFLTAGARVCPECVQERGYVDRLWHLRAYAACHRHEKLLIDRCEGCARPIRWLRRKLHQCDCGHVWDPGDQAPPVVVEVSSRFAEAAPCNDADPRRTLAGLVTIVWFFGCSGFADPRRRGVVARCAADIGVAVEVLTQGAPFITDWQRSFDGWAHERFQAQGARIGLHRDFGHELARLRNTFAEQCPFVIDEVRNYFSHHWQGYLFRRQSYFCVGPKVARFVPATDAAKMLGVRVQRIWEFVEAGQLSAGKRSAGSRTYRVIRADGVEALRRHFASLLTPTQAANALGISLTRFRQLDRAGFIIAEQIISQTKRFNPKTLRQFCHALASQDLPQPERSVRITELHRHRLVDLVADIKAGRLRAWFGAGEFDALSNLFVPVAEVEALRGPGGHGMLSAKRANERLGIGHRTLAALVKQQRARADWSEMGSLIAVAKSAVDEWKTDLVTSAGVARPLGLAPASVTRRLQQLGITPVLNADPEARVAALWARKDLQNIDFDTQWVTASGTLCVRPKRSGMKRLKLRDGRSIPEGNISLADLSKQTAIEKDTLRHLALNGYLTATQFNRAGHLRGVLRSSARTFQKTYVSSSEIAAEYGLAGSAVTRRLRSLGLRPILEIANNARVQACWRRSDVLDVDFRSQYILPCGRPSTPSQHSEAALLPARPSGSPRLSEGAIYVHVATGILGTNSSSLRAAVDAGHIRSASRSATGKVLTVVEADVLAFAERFVFTPKLAAELGLSATSVFRNLARLQVSPVWPGVRPVHALWDRRSFDTDVLLGRWVTSSGAMSEQSSLFEL